MSDIEQKLREQANITAEELGIPTERTYLWQAADHIGQLKAELMRALREVITYVENGSDQPAPTDEQIVKHYNTWLDSLEVQANFDDYPAFEAGYRAALQEEKK